MDFWSNWAIASVLLGYWVYLPSVGSSQSFNSLFTSVFLIALLDVSYLASSGIIIGMKAPHVDSSQLQVSP